jgi:hypothetical protein
MTRATADGIARALSDRAEFRQAERRRTLWLLLSELHRARERRSEWYTWVTEGMPRLTPDEYAALKGSKRKRRTSK